jgi:hypothetical protein
MRFVLPIVGLATMVAIGLKARHTTPLLLQATGVINVLVNNWWCLDIADPRRDILRHEFCQFASTSSRFRPFGTVLNLLLFE